MKTPSVSMTVSADISLEKCTTWQSLLNALMDSEDTEFTLTFRNIDVEQVKDFFIRPHISNRLACWETDNGDIVFCKSKGVNT